MPKKETAPNINVVLYELLDFSKLGEK